jgi:hypothetical protein
MIVYMRVTFTALIKQITIKSLVSLDKGVQIVLQCEGRDTELLKNLMEKHKADDTVEVTIE